MEPSQQYFLCYEAESWVVFGVMEVTEEEAAAIVIVLNDQFSESGHRVQFHRGTSTGGDDQSTLRRLSRESEFWQDLVSRSMDGTDDSIAEDYPVRYQCWSALGDAVSYVRDMTKKGRLQMPPQQPAAPLVSETTADWFFTSDPPSNSRFKYGPVIANLKSISNALGYDERTLKTNNGTSIVWIRRRHSREYSFWFEYEPEYEKARRATDQQD